MVHLAKILFHRMGVMLALIALQLFVYYSFMQWFSDYFVYYYWFGIAFSVGAVLWIISKSDNPAYKLGWVILIMLAPVFGGVTYLLFGGNRLSRRNQERLRTMEGKLKQNLSCDCDRSGYLSEVAGADAGNMACYLERAAVCPVYGNTETKYYPLGDDCLEDMLDALEGAKHYIFVEYFIIQEGKLWNAVLDILTEKAAKGVEVRVIYDDIGSMFTLPSNYRQQLEQRGLQCRVFNRLVPVVSLRLNNRDHRKYLIIDGETAFTGGINMADEYINAVKRFGHWKDSVVCLRGDAVWSMVVSFLSMWDYTEGIAEDFRPFRALPAPAVDKGFVQPYSDCPWDNEAVGQTVYLNLINRAQNYVYITTPYLIVDYTVMTALTTAAKSGVDVRLITPHIPDKKSVFEVTRANYRELVEAGVKVYEYTPGFMHAKSFVSDDRYAVVGSVNLDYRSMFLHFENGVMLYDTPTVLDVKRDFLSTVEKSQPITMEICNSIPLWRQVMRSIFKVFAPLL